MPTLVIRNLPKYATPRELKQFVTKYVLSASKNCEMCGISLQKPDKIRLLQDRVSFGCSCALCADSIQKTLHGMTWRKVVLKVTLSNSSENKTQSAQNGKESCATEPHTERKVLDIPRQKLTVDESEEGMLDSITPLRRMPYEDQVALKLQSSKQGFDALFRNVSGIMDHQRKQLREIEPHIEIKSSPCIEGYRNKSEFTIGYDSAGKFSVGFCAGSSNQIFTPQNACIVDLLTKHTVNVFIEFLNSDLCKWKSFDSAQDRSGVWRKLTVRSTACADCMVIASVNPTSLSDDSLTELKSALQNVFFSAPSTCNIRVTSLYIHFQRTTSDPGSFELIEGAPFIYERVFSLRFRISPDAFFQTNQSCCEVLYRTAAEMSGIRTSSTCSDAEATPITVWDICSGTGTISVYLSTFATVKKVIGVELCESAVRDAKINAENNGCSAKCEFYCGRAEEVIPPLLQKEQKSGSENDHLAVLDPPRAGVGGKLIAAIRSFSSLKRLLYISCDYKQAGKNFIDLMRVPSNRLPGMPFHLKRVVAVDMFPQTDHVEWILLFER